MKQALFMLIPLAIAPQAMAEGHQNNLALEGSLGFLNGASTENVFDTTGKKVSQLDWKIDNVPIIKLAAALDLNEKWTLKGGFWSAITDDGDAHMEDRDWLVANQSDPSHISISPDTKLRHAYELDLSATYWFLKRDQYQLGAVGGYQYTTFKWDGIGGSYSYNNGANVGTFPNAVGIDYKQEFGALYLGMAGSYQLNQSEFGFLVKWSPFVDASDVDHHYMRGNTYYEDSNELSDMIALTLNYGYHVTPQIKLYAEYAYTKYEEARADMTIVTNSGVGYVPNAASLDNHNSTATVGVKYTF
ncbi:omptin family outer membrane protease [Vibrio ostreicida]|uniref:omptin family outer membrane protease n=1 Tax=Vibrio ostreicida TaxID=526588 RepID=UPI000970BCF6|nr:omptin family outer membrane protease [Vibrio ostreicida]